MDHRSILMPSCSVVLRRCRLLESDDRACDDGADQQLVKVETPQLKQTRRISYTPDRRGDRSTRQQSSSQTQRSRSQSPSHHQRSQPRDNEQFRHSEHRDTDHQHNSQQCDADLHQRNQSRDNEQRRQNQLRDAEHRQNSQQREAEYQQRRSRQRDIERRRVVQHRSQIQNAEYQSDGARPRSSRGHRSRSPLQRDVDSIVNRDSTGNAAALNNKGKDELTFTEKVNANDTLTLLVQALRSIAQDSDKVHSVHNTIPEFDPSTKEQTMSMWLHKVNECATIYGWSEKQTIHYALPKLRGVAKRWYESLPSLLFSWKEWQSKLLSSFPSDENYGQMLCDMLAKRARFNESLKDYFYDKIALINRCGITGKRAVECVIHGIDDRTVRISAEAAQFEDLDKLLTFLRNANPEQTKF